MREEHSFNIPSVVVFDPKKDRLFNDLFTSKDCEIRTQESSPNSGPERDKCVKELFLEREWNKGKEQLSVIVVPIVKKCKKEKSTITFQKREERNKLMIAKDSRAVLYFRASNMDETG